MSEPALLIEIGCEEIPARMIRNAAADLARRVVLILDQAGLAHEQAQAWGGSRRLAVRVDAVCGRQADREDLVLGPPGSAALAPDGSLTAAAQGFARKQSVAPADLALHETERGSYIGFRRRVVGRDVCEILATTLPDAVQDMSFPKTMRWGDGSRRWVRPVHWVVALHGATVLPLELFGVAAGAVSVGHRFLGAPRVVLEHADRYLEALVQAHVLADPAERRSRLQAALDRAAKAAGGALVEDLALIEEVADLVEWPGVVSGSFDPAFLELPREILVTTLRHHQKCFTVQDPQGGLLPAFVAVANTDRDPAGHVRRGNEWVIRGRLDDARFFWSEDRTKPLAARAEALQHVVYQGKLGSYADKAQRMADLALRLAQQVGLESGLGADCRTAALLAKCDLVTGLVGEFPELQGRIGGLLLAAENQPTAVARGVYEHYQPAGPEDGLPPSPVGAVVSLSDKLDSVAGLIEVGETPTGSRDPFALRRSCASIFRIVLARDWPLAIDDLTALVGRPIERLTGFLQERLRHHFREQGYSSSEIAAVFRREVAEASSWSLPDIAARLEAIGTVRERGDFARLVELTKRVDNILTQHAADMPRIACAVTEPWIEDRDAALELAALVDRQRAGLDCAVGQRRYGDVVALLAEFVAPVARFFDDVLVVDAERPQATLWRLELLVRLRDVIVAAFDIRELAGQAERRTA